MLMCQYEGSLTRAYLNYPNFQDLTPTEDRPLLPELLYNYAMQNFDQLTLSSEDKQILVDFKSRRAIFDKYIEDKKIAVFTCPSCGYPTLSERGGYEICLICVREDDNQDDDTANEVWGGPNSSLSLTEGRLIIGRRIQEKIVSGSNLITDPERVMSIVDNSIKSDEDFTQQNIKDDTHINDPLWQQYDDKIAGIVDNLVD